MRFLAALLLLATWPAWATPPLDGSASGFVNHGSSFTITITTTQPNDVLLLYTRTECCQGAAGPARTVTGVASGTLIMAKRTACHIDASAGGAANDFGEACYWWVRAPLALTSEVFTVTLSGSTPTAAGFMAAFSGALNPSSPFDGNGTLPALFAHNGDPSGNVKTGAMSTNSTNTVLLAVGGDDNGAVVANSSINGGAWVKVGSINGNGSPDANFASASIGYFIQPSCASGISAIWTPSFDAYQSATWGDAIVTAGLNGCGGGPSPGQATQTWVHE